jgi:hypothetical protein
MGLRKSSTDLRAPSSFFIPVSWFDLEARFSAPTHSSRQPSRAGAVKDARLSRAREGLSLTAPSTMALSAGRDDDLRGARLSQCEINRTATLYAVGLEDPNHDAVLRIGREAPKRQVHSSLRHDSHRTSDGCPPPRTVIGDTSHVPERQKPPRTHRFRSMRRAQNETARHDAFANEAPQRDQQLSCQSNDHLLACAACSCCPLQEPLGQCAVLLEP